MNTPAKWPALQTWTLPALLKLERSWNQITPQTPEEHAAHNASMAELRGYIAQRSADFATIDVLP